jgi:4-amino-4-deoxy-L-arabinose transferase-like glycosyltransferase
VTPSATRSIARAALLLTAALLLVRIWFIGHRAIDLDEFEHAHAAWSVSRGQVPYVDFFEHHTPALYLLFAPLFAWMPVSTDARAAVAALIVGRGVMWVVTVISVSIVYRLGCLWRDRLTGALATVLLVTSSQFLESMLEFRPDVPAVLCLLIAAFGLTVAARVDDRRAHVWSAVAGAAFGVALLCTQKVVFAAPGIVVAFVAGRGRAARVGAFAVGTIVPVVATLAWFRSHDALRAFYFYTVVVNNQLNVDRFSPLPRLISNVVQQPALYALGFAGLVTSARTLGEHRERPVVVGIAASLAVGIFLIGKAYDQYYALLLPLLTVLGAAWVRDTFALTSARAAAAMILVTLLALTMSIRTFRSSALQFGAIAWVTEHTDPSDTYLGGSPGPALFRPHAWFYGFLTGPFAADRDYASLVDALESGRNRPALVIDDAYFERAPSPLLAYVRAHYRQQKEYGSLGLKIREASDRFDRPLIK